MKSARATIARTLIPATDGRRRTAVRFANGTEGVTVKIATRVIFERMDGNAWETAD